MAHWRNGSAFQSLKRFGKYRIGSASSVRQPNSVIQRTEQTQQTDLFPSHIKKDVPTFDQGANSVPPRV